MGRNIRAYSAILLSLALVGCGVGSARRSSATAPGTFTSVDNFAISAISPASGEVTSVPSTVVITFNQAYLAPDATTLSYYNLSCGGNVFQASSVQYIYGSSYVTVTLPAVGALTAGTACYFSVSPSVTNEAGYSTIGIRSAAYYLANNVSLAANASSVGGGGGTGFTETAGSLALLSGLNVRAGSYVAAAQGEWQENFRSGGAVVSGSVHGDGSFPLNTSFSCPDGMRITGLRGRAGGYVYAIGIVCKDSTQATYWESPVAGGNGGGAFSVTCPAGTFAAGITGRSGAGLEQIALVCQ